MSLFRNIANSSVIIEGYDKSNSVIYEIPYVLKVSEKCYARRVEKMYRDYLKCVWREGMNV
jgi:hypothetical protein